MTRDTLLRFAGASALAGGALRVLDSFIPYVADSAPHEALYLLIDLLFLFGLFGIYAARAERLGPVGLVGFLVAATGNALIVGPDTVFQGIDTYQTGAAIFALGLAVFALPLLWTRSLGRLAPVLWILTPVVSVAAGASGFGAQGFMAAGILFGLGFFAAGLELLRRPAN